MSRIKLWFKGCVSRIFFFLPSNGKKVNYKTNIFFSVVLIEKHIIFWGNMPPPQQTHTHTSSKFWRRATSSVRLNLFFIYLQYLLFSEGETSGSPIKAKKMTQIKQFGKKKKKTHRGNLATSCCEVFRGGNEGGGNTMTAHKTSLASLPSPH